MVDHPRLTFGPRRLAVHPRAGGAARSEVEREIAATKVVIPAKAGIQYAEASRFNHRRLWNAGSPDPVYAEASTGYGSWAAEASAKVASRAMTVMGLDATSGSSRPVQKLKRVNRGRSFADLEMELRRPHLARLARFGNHLAALDGVAALHQQLTRMGICGDVAVGVPNQDQIAITLQLISAIGDDPILGGLHRRAFGHRQVDTVVGLAVGLGAIGRDHLAAHRPAEGRQRAGCFARFDRSRGGSRVVRRRGRLREPRALRGNG